jgi:L-iditol 2-dehydrogenase
MKAAFYNGANKMEIKEYASPTPKEGEALIKIRATGICGSDLNMNLAKTSADEAPAGHEVAGEIVDVGKNVNKDLIGNRVAVEVLGSGKSCYACWYCRQGQYIHCSNKDNDGNGGFAELITRKIGGCYKLGDNMTWELGALVEPLAVSIHAAKLGNLKGGETVAILGSGTIGLTAVTAAKALGARNIFISARHKQQSEMALSLGATNVANPEGNDFENMILDATDGKGADITIETVGGSKGTTLTQSVDVTRRQGRIVILGIFYGNHGINWNGPILKEQTLQGSICYGLIDGKHDFEAAIEILSDPTVKLENIVTHKYPMSKIQHAFETAYDKSTGSIKVQILQD